jgi:hypothetical protein
MASTQLEGGCFCGAVRYRAVAPPLGSMICECQSCRRVAAAPSVPWLTFELAAFSFTRGEPETFRSSAGVRRAFCRDCGTPLTYLSDKTPTEIDVTTCSLDEPERFPPTHRSWMSHALSWWRSNSELPSYDQSKTATKHEDT